MKRFCVMIVVDSTEPYKNSKARDERFELHICSCSAQSTFGRKRMTFVIRIAH